MAAPAVQDAPPTPAGPEADASDDPPEQSPDPDPTDAPADDLAQPFSMDLEHLGVDRTGELSEPEHSARPTTVEQEQRPLGGLFRGV